MLHLVKVCAHFEGLVYIAANQSVHVFFAFQGEVTGQHSGQGFPNSIWSAGDFGTLALSHARSNLFFNWENSFSMLTTKKLKRIMVGGKKHRISSQLCFCVPSRR